MRISLRSRTAIAVGRITYWFLHTFMKGGSSLPGKLAARIDPDILDALGADRETIVITGTNGKTLTTNLTVKVLQQQYDDILTNNTGSNMMQGIITAYLAHKVPKNARRKVAVLEVDEANVAPVSSYLHPDVFVMTNIFRDQMDRYGEFYTTYDKILKGVKANPEALVVANGDAPIFNSRELQNPMRFFGFALKEQKNVDEFAPVNTDGVLCPVCEHILHYHGITYANLGNYFCVNCGFARPILTSAVTAVIEETPTQSTFAIDHQKMTLGVGGLYNVYNALAAYTVGTALGITPEDAAAAFNSDGKVFGRQEEIKVGDKLVTLILVKNPVGLNSVLDLIEKQKDPFALGVLLNANYADGTDTSWIWDGNFEELIESNPERTYFVGGEREKDIAFRLQVAGANEKHLGRYPELKEVLSEIQAVPEEHVYILATYTAVLQLRKLMAEHGYIEGGF